MLTTVPGGPAYGSLEGGTTYELPYDYAKSLVDAGSAKYANAVVPYSNPPDTVGPTAAAAVAATMGSFYAVPETNTRAGIQAAIDAVVASPTATGTVWLKDAIYDCSDGQSITLKNGVNIMGPFCPVMVDINRVPDSVYLFSAGARLVGNGQPIFVYNNVDNAGAVPATLNFLRGAMYRNMAFIGCSSGFAVGSYNNAGAVDCFWENILHSKTTDFGSKFQNLMHCTLKHLGFYSCQGMLYQINNIDGQYLQAGNNVVDDIFGVVAVGGDGYTARSIRLRRGHVLGCAVGGITGIPWQGQGVSTYGRLQANMFGRTEYTTGATVGMTSGSPDFSVPECAEFPVGMQFLNVTAAGGLIANYVYTVVAKSVASGAGTIQISESPSRNPINANATISNATTFKSRGHAPLVIQGRPSNGTGADAGTGTAFGGVTFLSLDLEGIASAGLVCEWLGNVTFNAISALPDDGVNGCYKQLIFENCKGGPIVFGTPNSLASVQQGTSVGVVLHGKWDIDNASNYVNAVNIKWPQLFGRDVGDLGILSFTYGNRSGAPTFRDRYLDPNGGGPTSLVQLGVPMGRFVKETGNGGVVSFGYNAGLSTAILNDGSAKTKTLPIVTSRGTQMHGFDQLIYNASAFNQTIQPDGANTFWDGTTSKVLRPKEFLWVIWENDRNYWGCLSTNITTYADVTGSAINNGGTITSNTQRVKMRVNAGATSFTWTNSLIQADSQLGGAMSTNDATAAFKGYACSSGSAVIYTTSNTGTCNYDLWIVR